MIFGMPFGCPFGRPEEWFTHLACTSLQGMNYMLSWTVADQCDGYYQVSIAGVKSGNPVYSVAGVQASKIIQLSPGAQILSIVCQGQFPGRDVSISDELSYYAAGSFHGFNAFQANILSIPTVSHDGDAGQISSIVLAGLKRGNNIAPVQGRPTWGQYAASLVTVGGVHTLTLAVNGRNMITGSRTGDGTINLSGAGVVGTVALAYTGDFADARVYVRWPAQYAVYVKPGAAFATGDFTPRAITAFSATTTTVTITSAAHGFVVGQRITLATGSPYASTAYLNGNFTITATTANTFTYTATGVVLAASATGTAALCISAAIADDGTSNQFIFKSVSQDTGNTFYVVVHQRGDDGNESTSIQSGGLAITTQTIPAAPTVPTYVSGHFAATIINYVAPAGVTAFHIYDSGAAGVLNFTTPTLSPGSGGNQTLPAIAAGFSGIRYVFVRSVIAGVEEGNLEILQINYSAGQVVALQPPPPSANAKITNGGRALTVPFTIYLDPTLSTPATVKLFVYTRAAGVDYTTPLTTLTLPAISPQSKTFVSQIGGTVAANGIYYYQLRTYGATGVPSDNVNEYGPVLLTTSVFPEPKFSLVEGI